MLWERLVCPNLNSERCTKEPDHSWHDAAWLRGSFQWLHWSRVNIPRADCLLVCTIPDAPPLFSNVYSNMRNWILKCEILWKVCCLRPSLQIDTSRRAPFSPVSFLSLLQLPFDLNAISHADFVQKCKSSPQGFSNTLVLPRAAFASFFLNFFPMLETKTTPTQIWPFIPLPTYLPSSFP